jgi:hypothetical protein
MNPITIPNISIPTIGIPTIGIPSVGFPSASGGGSLSWPAGMKEHIKAWYDPKKQGMTNFDVIESYAEDFTASKWVTVQDRAVFTKTASKIHITESLSDGFNTTFIETSQSRYGNEMKINVSGIVAGGVTLKYRYGSYEEVVDITSNGVYTLPAGKAGTNPNGYNGFVMKAKGKCDITITQLPTSILKDFSGNGNHAYLYGGKGKLNSGMGVYKQDYTTYKNDGNTNVEDVKPDTFVLLAGNLSRLGMPYKDIVGENIPAYKINVTGITDGTVTYFYRNEDGKQLQYVIKSDGEYELPTCYREGTEGTAVNIVANNNSNKITITQIPDYPDQLCYDGKMYAVCYGFPILTDYTVMAERTWFEKEEYSAFISNSLGGMEEPGNGAFSVELKSLNSFTTISFGSITSIGIPEKGITYQTKQSYNGNSINVGTKESNDILILGGRYFYKNGNVAGNTWTGCHGTIIIADRSFTEEEINWLKQNWDKI